LSTEKKFLEGQRFCPYGNTISIIGSYWNLMIIKEFYLQKKLANISEHRFNEILKNLAPISSKTLSTKLKELSNAGIMKRKVKDQTPVLITYELTQKGFELNKVMDAMAAWTVKWESQKIPLDILPKLKQQFQVTT
jgi:DNA-binding HxlR family transcriptional regulator